MSNALAVVEGEVVSSSTLAKPQNAAELYRHATDVAGACGEIVKRTAMAIQGRRYVKVEGWQTIANTFGCVASARDVETVPGGIRAIGEIRRISDGAIIATAEGFLGDDEPLWFGGGHNPKTGQPFERRPLYARRAMAQTRAISRACRTAFAFVVVMIDSELSTTPAEEVPDGGFNDASKAMPPPAGVDKLRRQITAKPAPPAPPSPPKAHRVAIVDVPGTRTHEDMSFNFGQSKGVAISRMDENSLSFYAGAFKRDLESTDPAKVKWATKTRQQLDAVTAELRFRGLPA